MVRLLTAILITIIILSILWLALGQPTFPGGGRTVIGAREMVTVLSPQGEVSFEAKIDTGAAISSIDRRLALSLGYKPNTQNKVKIVTAEGSDVRDTVNITFRLGKRRITARASIAARTILSTRIRIGRNDLSGFVVDPAREFVASESNPAGIPATVRIIGGKETVTLHSPSGEVRAVARIDTGTSISSIDQEFALSLGYRPDQRDTVKVVTAVGTDERHTVRLTYNLDDKRISAKATVEERGGLSTRLLIGRDDLAGFMVDPSLEFTVLGVGAPAEE